MKILITLLFIFLSSASMAQKSKEVWLEGSVEFENGERLFGEINYNVLTQLVKCKTSAQWKNGNPESLKHFSINKGKDVYNFYALPINDTFSFFEVFAQVEDIVLVRHFYNRKTVVRYLPISDESYIEKLLDRAELESKMTPKELKEYRKNQERYGEDYLLNQKEKYKPGREFFNGFSEGRTNRNYYSASFQFLFIDNKGIYHEAIQESFADYFNLQEDDFSSFIKKEGIDFQIPDHLVKVLKYALLNVRPGD